MTYFQTHKDMERKVFHYLFVTSKKQKTALFSQADQFSIVTLKKSCRDQIHFINVFNYSPFLHRGKLPQSQFPDYQ